MDPRRPVKSARLYQQPIIALCIVVALVFGTAADAIIRHYRAGLADKESSQGDKATCKPTALSQSPLPAATSSWTTFSHAIYPIDFQIPPGTEIEGMLDFSIGGWPPETANGLHILPTDGSSVDIRIDDQSPQTSSPKTQAVIGNNRIEFQRRESHDAPRVALDGTCVVDVHLVAQRNGLVVTIHYYDGDSIGDAIAHSLRFTTANFNVESLRQRAGHLYLKTPSTSSGIK